MNPGSPLAKLIDSSQGSMAELMRLVDRQGDQFVSTLPRAVHVEIHALQHQNMKKNNDDDDFRRRKKLEEEELYGVAGITGVRESNILEMGRSEGGGNVSFSKDVDSMDSTERLQYFSKASKLTYEQFMALPEAERNKIVENAEKDGAERLAKAEKGLVESKERALNDPALGATPEARKEALESIDNAIDIKYSSKEAEARIKLLPEHLQALATERREYVREQHYGQMQLEGAKKYREAKNEGDTREAYNQLTDVSNTAKVATAKAEQGEAKIAAANMATASGRQEAAAAAKETDNAIGQPLVSATNEQRAEIAKAVEAETNARTQAHAQVAKQDHNAAASQSLDLGDETPAPTQVASVGGRKSIDIPDLNGKPIVSPDAWMLAQLGKPMEAEKALEPELKPEPQQPKAPKTTLET